MNTSDLSFVGYASPTRRVVRFAPDSDNRILSFWNDDDGTGWHGHERNSLRANSALPLEDCAEWAEALEAIWLKHGPGGGGSAPAPVVPVPPSDVYTDDLGTPSQDVQIPAIPESVAARYPGSECGAGIYAPKASASSVLAPTEDVAIIGFARGTFSHEGRIALLSCNHSQVVPESFTTADRVKCATCFPSPAEPVKVPAPTEAVRTATPEGLGLEFPLVWAPTDSGSVMHAQQAIIMDYMGFKLAECSIEFARAACRGLNSHAAHLAKIHEADEIMKRCAMWLGKMIADGAHLNSTLPNDCVRTLERVEAFRAALALPTAPQGS